MSELVEINAKLGRARLNIENIKKLVPGGGTPVRSSDGITFKSEPNGLRHEFFVKVREPSIEFRLGIGDILHDARTSLDHLIYRILVKRGGLDEAKKTGKLRNVQFLVYDDAQKFKATAGKFKDLVGIDVIAAMEALQKHKGSSDCRSLHLWQLAELDNITKHRAIPVVYERLVGAKVTVSVLGEVIKTFPLHDPEGKPLKDGAKLFALEFDHRPPEMHVDVNRTSAIVFADTGVCDGYGIWPVLRRIIDSTQSVVDDFAEQFLV